MPPGAPSGLLQDPSSPDLRLGSVLNQTYRLERVLGVGGMGTVYAAQHVLLQQPVAIKILHQRMGDRHISLERFRREAQIAAQLRHPGLVSVLDFNLTEDGAPYMVMEYLGGQTLQERLARGPLGLAETCALFEQLGDALHAVHEAGVVHRDLKPENIILLRTDPAGRPLSPAEPPRIKLLDFGVSKILSDAQGIDHGGTEAGPGAAQKTSGRDAQSAAVHDTEIVGTPSYLAPEQAAGRGYVVDRRADLFALGTILYECLTGQRAFDGPHALAVLRLMMTEPVPSLAQRLLELALPQDVLLALDQVVARACAKDPAARYATALAFLQALRAAVPAASAATAPLLSGPPDEMDWSDGDTMYDAKVDSLRRAAAEYEGSAVTTMQQGLRPGAQMAAALTLEAARAETEITLADESQRLSAKVASPLPAGAVPEPAGRGPSTFATERPTTIMDTIGTPPQGSAAPAYGAELAPTGPDVPTGVMVPMVPMVNVLSRRGGVRATVVTALLAVLLGIVVGMLLLKLMSRGAAPSLALERTQQLEQLLGEAEELLQKARCDEAIQRASAVLLIDRQNARAREIQRRCTQR